MFSPLRRPAHLPLLMRDYEGPHAPSASYIDFTSTSIAKLEEAKSRTGESEEEWANNFERTEVWGNGWEERVVVSIGHQTSLLSIGISMISQAFTILYLTLLIYFTQQLSLRRNLSIKQTLTATHDKSTAWTGLGSALVSLFSQINLPASLGGVAIITLYLLGVATLKVSTPSLFAVVPFNMTVMDHVQTEIGSPFTMVPQDRITVAATSAALPVIAQLPTIGLSGNVLFDVLNENHGIGNATVNTTTINVKCGALPGVVEQAMIFQTGGSGRLIDNDTATWEVSIPVQGLEQGAGNVSAFVYTMENPLYSLQAIGCSLEVSNNTDLVDPQSKQLLTSPMPKTYSNWTSWQPIPEEGIWLTDMWQTLMVNGLPSNHAPSGDTFFNAGDLPGLYPLLSVIEVSVLTELGWLSSNGKNGPVEGTNSAGLVPIPAKLHELENALAKTTAALFWSAGHIGQLEVEKPQNHTGLAQIQQPLLASHLKLNVLPISVGLGTSIVLFILSMLMVGFSDDIKPGVENVGILHVFWMSAVGSVGQKRIARVGEPTTQALREAGMFKMRIADGSTDNELDTRSLMEIAGRFR
ncbi:hypothetical protein BDZ94DRAFT_1305594 [Collybia nuda]|uniref:Uncharacterized protein n=1 Tax=Collybia nuda TaxID=64659 RepID=A0A9P5YDX7_9AGAR|nr:hypothetical protein BDZ94DRAFT_1305594 [Collybia nuda]